LITQVLKIDPANPEVEHIIKAAQALKNGGIVAFPTETVYGLAANFFDEKAVKKLHEVKKRPEGKPFTVQIADRNGMDRFKCEISSLAREFMEKFWPGPLTLIFNTAVSGKVGIRLPNNRIARELIRQSGTLIAAPSANISGTTPPREAREVLAQFKDKIDIILDAGETQLGKESTVVDFTAVPYRIARIGVIPKEKIAQAEFDFWKLKVGPCIKKILFVCTGNSCRSAMAEGYLKKRLKQVERDDIEVFSRGVSAHGVPGPTSETLEVLKGDGIDMSGHRPTLLSRDDIESADLILAMEDFQIENILQHAPHKKDRVYLLAEFGLWGGKVQEASLELPDPIGKPLNVYKDVFGLVKNSIERLVKILI
jgi:tRNA threonylcarbamoyl adenosine modification protein (Sua5/YciO/YrdC/YwlC family)